MASLEDLIPLVNKLQDLVFNTIGSDTLDLPQVVVVGSQSCGKSSVLENIVGRDFLPRGTGIVTRRPLILQLVNIPSNKPTQPELPTTPQFSSSFELGGAAAAVGTTGHTEVNPHHRLSQPAQYEEWGEFLHIPGQRYYDFSQIRREIEIETSRIAGNNKGINRLPINLKIFSPHVLNLTLVDLPGLTKIPIGDQPTDIERQTRNLILEYIAKPNSIILAVSPANVDLVNSESLKLARQVDPQGKRTIGILTKLDLMDHGTNALDILSGNVYPLKLGFIGVVNRSQQDIHANKLLTDSLAAEREFFASHPAYKNISHRCGTAFLAKSLNHTLMGHIRDRLPDIKARLNTLMGQTEQELASYGDATFTGPENRGALVLQLMTKFATSFVTSIEGTSSEISTKELCGGARIYYIYKQVFGHSLETLDPVANLSIKDIRTAIRNSTGPRPSLFVPELAFDLLVKPQIKLLEPPSQRCVELVYEELMKICHNCGSSELARYPRLQAKLIEVVSELLRERLGPTSSYVTSLIAIQRAYINTNHPNFLGAAAAMASIMDEKKQKDKNDALEELRLQAQAESRAAAEEAAELNAVAINSNNNNKKGTNKHSKSKSNDTVASASTNSAGQNSASSVTVVDSPAGINGNAQLSTAGNGSAANGGSAGGKDSFLNYFFGKDSANTPSTSVPSADNSFKPATQSTTTYDGFLANSGPEDITEEEFQNGEEKLSDKELFECELIRRLIISYFHIVRESIQDQVPKAVMHLLVNYCKESTQNRLVSKLYKDSLFDELLYEDETLAQERQKCENMLATYREAAKIIGEVV